MTDKVTRTEEFMRAVAILRRLTPFYQTLALHAAINWGEPEFIAHAEAIDIMISKGELQ